MEYFWFVDLFPFLFGIMAAYSSWYEFITELPMASGKDPAEIENELASIGGEFGVKQAGSTGLSLQLQ